MLTNKYLKYNPSITFEIFQKIWDKLYQDGWKRHNQQNIEYTYNEFKGLYSYLSDRRDKEFNCYVSDLGNSEITVDEILKGKEINQFIKNDYIVILDMREDFSDCARNNYCFKIRKNDTGINPCVDIEGRTGNGNNSLKADKTSYLKDWRYATNEEIAHYELVLKPFDVTKITTSSSSHGLVIGTKYDADILTEWYRKEGHFYSYSRWKAGLIPFSSPRTITGFDIKDYVAGFTLSGIGTNVHFKCEGFKEFATSKTIKVKQNFIEYCTRHVQADPSVRTQDYFPEIIELNFD